MRTIGGSVRSSAVVVVVSVVVLATASNGPLTAPVAVASRPDDHRIARRGPTVPGSDPTAEVLDAARPRTSAAPTTSAAPSTSVTSVVAAGHAAVRSPVGLDTFLVGDSSMVEAVGVTGVGSAFSGHGFTAEAAMGVRNPLLAPAGGYEGLVVLGVSVWDAHATDLSGYREATDRYRSAGYEVVWIEVPPAGVRYDGGPLNPDLVRLNDAVADHLGCDLQPWKLRDVETYGSATDDRVNGDWVHPTPLGGRRIAENASKLTAADACEPRQDDPVPRVEAATCTVVVYTPPTASTAREAELCVPAGSAATTVVLVHGGGGHEGHRSQVDPWRDAHLAAGRATLSIDYALLDRSETGEGPLWPLPEQNLKAAVQFVRADDAVPTDTVVVHGFSAGARLAGIVATTANNLHFAGPELWPDVSDAVDAAVLFYGYHDGSQVFPNAYYGTHHPAEAAAIDQIDSTDAPLLLVHGTADVLIPAEQSETLATAATNAGVTVDLVLVDGQGHSFDGYGSSSLTDAGRDLVDDIDAHLVALGARS